MEVVICAFKKSHCLNDHGEGPHLHVWAVADYQDNECDGASDHPGTLDIVADAAAAAWSLETVTFHIFVIFGLMIDALLYKLPFFIGISIDARVTL
jgi:hypothetical protein